MTEKNCAMCQHFLPNKEKPNEFPGVCRRYPPVVLMVPNAFDLVQEGVEFWGEDFVFCKRLRQLGIEIWAECNIDFQHVGMNAWNGNLVHKVANGPLTRPLYTLAGVNDSKSSAA